MRVKTEISCLSYHDFIIVAGGIYRLQNMNSFAKYAKFSMDFLLRIEISRRKTIFAKKWKGEPKRWCPETLDKWKWYLSLKFFFSDRIFTTHPFLYAPRIFSSGRRIFNHQFAPRPCLSAFGFVTRRPLFHLPPEAQHASLFLLDGCHVSLSFLDHASPAVFHSYTCSDFNSLLPVTFSSPCTRLLTVERRKRGTTLTRYFLIFLYSYQFTPNIYRVTAANYRWLVTVILFSRYTKAVLCLLSIPKKM